MFTFYLCLIKKFIANISKYEISSKRTRTKLPVSTLQINLTYQKQSAYFLLYQLIMLFSPKK
jgi:hypothetical protein